MIKYVFWDDDEKKYVLDCYMANTKGRSHLAFNYTDNVNKALMIKAIAYEPNHTRLAETWTSLTNHVFHALPIEAQH